MAPGYQCCASCATTSWSTSASTEQPCPSGCPWWVRTGLLWLLKAPALAARAGFVSMAGGTVSGDSPQKCCSLWAPPELPLKLSFVEVSLCCGLIQFCIINTLESHYNWWGPDMELSWVVAGDVLLLEIKSCGTWCWSGVPLPAPALPHVLTRAELPPSNDNNTLAALCCSSRQDKTMRWLSLKPHIPGNFPFLLVFPTLGPSACLASLRRVKKCRICHFPW